MKDNSSLLVSAVAEVVAAYANNHELSIDELVNLIEQVSQSFSKIEQLQPNAILPEPAVPIEQSIKDEYIICLEDGEKFKSLKRHLASKYGMTPDEYRAKWGLLESYPMVAPNYKRKRSELAKEFGLGTTSSSMSRRKKDKIA